MSETIEMVMMSDAILIILVGKTDVKDVPKGNIFSAGINAVVSIFGIAWMGSTFYTGNAGAINDALSGMVAAAPLLFAVALFLLSIMLFSQAATVTTLYPVGIALGISPLLLVAMFPAVNGYFFLPNYPTEVAALGFDRTGTTHVGRYVINHSFQLPGFVTTIVAIGVGFGVDEPGLDTPLVFGIIDKRFAYVVLYESSHNDGDDACGDAHDEDGAELYAFPAQQILRDDSCRGCRHRTARDA